MNPQLLFGVRFVFSSFLVLASSNVIAQQVPIRADVYRWDSAPVVKKGTSQQRTLLEGTTPAFHHVKVHATTVAAGQAAHPGHQHNDEELIIVKEGQLTVTIAGKVVTLEKGSIALIMPGDEHALSNGGKEPVTYYIMRYETEKPQPERSASGSLVKHWHELDYKTHDKGGRRNVFDRATPHSERFEMHITTLNEGLMSHPPHTHKAAEILLLLEGQAEESIEGKWIPAGVGDVIFLQSQVPHAIRNTGKGAATYFAFQFE
jgi:(S)-ureidoglycine aminohydrolase